MLLSRDSSLGRGPLDDDRSDYRLIGQSAVMREVRALVARAAASTRTVFVAGEAGTGKTLVAALIHAASAQARRALTILRANDDGLARLRQATAATVVITNLDAAVSAMRRSLEQCVAEMHVRCPGFESVPRVIVTGEALDVLGGAIDLTFAGAAVFPICLPPLRDRRSDIPALVEHFRASHAAERGIESRPFDASDVVPLLSRDWARGNVRELREWVHERLVPDTLPADAPPANPPNFQVPTGSIWTLAQLERHYIEHILERVRGNQSRAAAELGIDRRTLYRKLKEYRFVGVSSGEA